VVRSAILMVCCVTVRIPALTTRRLGSAMPMASVDDRNTTWRLVYRFDHDVIDACRRRLQGYDQHTREREDQ
jgi:hypothetical protein